MQISSLTLPKDRSLRVPNDDTVLILPDLLGLFDGATSPQGKNKSGSSSGRLASQSAALAVAQLALEEALTDLPPSAIFAPISARIGEASRRHGMEGKPSTTMALAVFGPEEVRLILVGDSAIRVNGSQLIQKKKPIDDVSTQSRLAVHAILSRRHEDTDKVEHLSRFVAFEGYAEALAQGILTGPEVAQIREDMVVRFADRSDPETVQGFLDLGIRSQFRLANRRDHPLGYSTLNSDETSLTDIIDIRLPLSNLNSIELFTDGYFQIPDAIGIADWENAFALSEAEDFHKTRRFANVKGSTSREFADDRSIIVADAISGGKGA